MKSTSTHNQGVRKMTNSFRILQQILKTQLVRTLIGKELLIMKAIGGNKVLKMREETGNILMTGEMALQEIWMETGRKVQLTIGPRELQEMKVSMIIRMKPRRIGTKMV